MGGLSASLGLFIYRPKAACRNESGNTVAVSERDRVGTEKETDIAWRFGSAGGQCDTQLPLL